MYSIISRVSWLQFSQGVVFCVLGHVLLYDLRGAAKPLSIVEPSGGEGSSRHIRTSNGVQWVQFSQDKVQAKFSILVSI